MAVNAQDILLVKAGMDAISDLLLKDGRSARHSKRKVRCAARRRRSHKLRPGLSRSALFTTAGHDRRAEGGGGLRHRRQAAPEVRGPGRLSVCLGGCQRATGAAARLPICFAGTDQFVLPQRYRGAAPGGRVRQPGASTTDRQQLAVRIVAHRF